MTLIQAKGPEMQGLGLNGSPPPQEKEGGVVWTNERKEVVVQAFSVHTPHYPYPPPPAQGPALLLHYCTLDGMDLRGYRWLPESFQNS